MTGTTRPPPFPEVSKNTNAISYLISVFLFEPKQGGVHFHFKGTVERKANKRGCQKRAKNKPEERTRKRKEEKKKKKTLSTGCHL